MRPRAVVFIGNGFTIALSQYLKIDWHDTRQLLPPPQWLQDKSAATHPFGLPLWDEKRYPDLWLKWHELARSTGEAHVPSLQDFAASIAGERSFARGPGNGPRPKIGYGSTDAGFQLRRYLWHFFFGLAERFVSHVESTGCEGAPAPAEFARSLFHATAEWPLIRALRELAEIWDLTLVSFNYDGYLEQTLQAHGCQFVDVRFHDGTMATPVPLGSFRVLHPHGELATHRAVARDSSLQLGDEMFHLSRGMQMMFTNDYNYDDNTEVFFPPRLPCPGFPNLVPPGHDQSHLVEGILEYQEAIKSLVGCAEAIGSIGFSAAYPDNIELEGYLATARAEAISFSIARTAEDVAKEPSGQLIAAAARGARGVFGISEMDEFLAWVRDQFSAAFAVANKNGAPNLAELFVLALRCVNRGESDRMKEALQLFDGLDAGVRAETSELLANYLRGEYERQAGRPDHALRHYDAALKAAEILFSDEKAPLAHLWLKVSQCFLMAGDGDTARQTLGLASRCAPPEQDPWDQAEFDSTEAQVCLAEGKLSAARDALHRSYSVYLSINDYPNAALARLQSGNASLREQQFAEAEEAFREACMLYRDSGDLAGVGMSLASLSDLQRKCAAELPESEARSELLRSSINGYLEAIQLLEARSQTEMALTLIGLMVAHHLNGDTSAVLVTAARAREICGSVPLPDLLETVQHLEQEFLRTRVVT